MHFPLERLRVPCSLARCWGSLQGGCVEPGGGRVQPPRGLPALLLGPGWPAVCPTVTPCPQPSRAAPFPAWDRVGQNRGWAPGSPQPGCSSRPHWGGSFAARRSPGCRRAGLRNAGGQHCWFQWSLAVFSRHVSWRSVKRSCCLAVAFLALTVPAGPRLWARSGRRTQRAALSPQGPRTSPDSLASASAWWSPRE